MRHIKRLPVTVGLLLAGVWTSLPALQLAVSGDYSTPFWLSSWTFVSVAYATAKEILEGEA